MTDAALVTLLRAKEPRARAVLVDRYAFYVERLIVRTVGFDAEVPDLVNDVFLHALEGIDELRESSALKGWIGSIAVFTARGFLRNRGIRRRWLRVMPFDKVPDRPAPVWRPEVSEMLEHARAVFNSLPVDERTAFALRIAGGWRLAEIAKNAGVSLATVKRRLARAERRLRDAGVSDSP